MSDEGFGEAEALLRVLIREKRIRSVRPALIRTVIGGISVWVASSVVFGVFYTHFVRGGWQGHVAAGSLSISEVSNAIWRSALVVMVLMWLVEAHTTPDRRGVKIGLAGVGVAALAAWVVSTCAYAILTAPLGGISGTAVNVFAIAARVLHVSLVVWTSALAALVLMWMVRATAIHGRQIRGSRTR